MIELVGSAVMFVVVVVFAIVVQHKTVRKVEKKVRSVEAASDSLVQKLRSSSGPLKPVGGDRK